MTKKRDFSAYRIEMDGLSKKQNPSYAEKLQQ
jgi:hypothetical protein